MTPEAPYAVVTSRDYSTALKPRRTADSEQLRRVLYSAYRIERGGVVDCWRVTNWGARRTEQASFQRLAQQRDLGRKRY
jgi:hypothetical protein